MTNLARKPFVKEFFKTTRTFRRETIVSNVLRENEIVTITSYNPNRGFGFGSCKDGTQVYFETTVLTASRIMNLFPKDKIIANLGKNTKKPDYLTVLKIHDVVKQEQTTTGIALFHYHGNPSFEGGYVKTDDRGSIFVPSSVLDECNVNNIDKTQPLEVTYVRKDSMLCATKVKLAKGFSSIIGMPVKPSMFNYSSIRSGVASSERI